jgi:membrane protease YdiL (CAAX protease family)
MADPSIAIDSAARRRVIRELTLYFALTFAITFGLGAAVIFFRPEFEAVFGPLGPLLQSWPYYLGVSAPTISAVVLSAAFGGWVGVKNLFAGLFRRFAPRWLFVALLTFPAGLLLWGTIERIVQPTNASHAIDFHAMLGAAPLWFTTTILLVDPGPWGEETGWRGFALPRLLALFSPLTSAIVLGVIWALWHAPAFLASGLTQYGLNFGWFLVGATCLSVVMTWIYVNANRNYFVAGVIPHAMSNLMGTTHVFADVRTEALAYVAIAALIALSCGPSLKFSRFAQATQRQA